MSKHRIICLLLCLALALLAGCGAGDAAVSAPASVAASLPADEAVSSVASSQAAASVPAQAASAASGMPLTGMPADQTTARPVAVVVSNAPAAAARQWGLADASVVLEGLTEGKTTNLMLWYDALAAVPKVGPIAQGKDLYWQFALPQNSIVVQRGGNRYAENLLNCYGWQPLDALYTGVNCFDFDGSDPAAAVEYSWFTQGATLQNGVAYYGMAVDGTVPPWLTFGTASGGAAASVLTIGYSDSTATTLRYIDGVYSMFRTDGTAQLDGTTGVQAAFQNVLVLYCAPGVKDDIYTREYDLTEGSGLYLTNGTWQTIRWTKGDAASALHLYDASGKELTVTPGKTYMGIYGGFAGQSVALYGPDGAVLDPGLAAPAPIAAAG